MRNMPLQIVVKKFLRFFGSFCENLPSRCVKHSEGQIFSFGPQ